MKAPIITKVVIDPSRGFEKFQATIMVEWSDSASGGFVKLFDYYDDELSFSPGEFIGLTREQTGQLFLKKDVAYLQS